MLGRTRLWFSVGGGGGTQVGLIGSGGGAGGGGGDGLGGGGGEVSMEGRTHPVPTVSERIRMREITKYFIVLIADFILAHGQN